MKPPSSVFPDKPYSPEEHLAHVQALFDAWPLTTEKACDEHTLDILVAFLKDKTPWALLPYLKRFVNTMMFENGIYRGGRPNSLDPKVLIKLQEQLNPERIKKATTCFYTFFNQLIPELPTFAFSKEPATLTVVLKELIDTHALVPNVFLAFHEPELPILQEQLTANAFRLSRQDRKSEKPKLIRPEDYKGDPLDYLRNTPLIELLNAPIPFAIPREKFTEHTAIFAPTGGGKTVTLQALILDHLKTGTPMFIMDSMGAMLKKVERLKHFAGSDKLVILDPTDEKPPALNFFKINAPPAKQMELFFYLFKAIDQGLTVRQATTVSFLFELMQAVPDATLDTLREVCESKAPIYDAEIYALSPIAQDFFRNQFYSKDPLINQTKQQIAARLYTIGRNQVFNRMFGATENKFDAFKCMQEGKVVLINTDRLYLGDEASGIFGRFIIAQCLAAALGRAGISEKHRRLALLIVDEAKAYLDDQAEKILSDARQFGLGLILATQSPHQLPEGVQREVANNTSIKMIGSVSYSIASTLARDMHTSPEFIQSMQAKPPHTVEFATYVRGFTPQAVKLSVPIGLLEQEPQMSDGEWRAMRARNRERYGTHEVPTREAPRAHVSKSPEGDTPIMPAQQKPKIDPPRKEVKAEPKKPEVKPTKSKDHTTPDPDY